MTLAIPGFGFYVANFRLSSKEIIEISLACGATWIYPRLGQDGWQPGAWGASAQQLESFRKAGLKICGWMYATLGGAEPMIGAVRGLASVGLIDAFASDPEAEWRGIAFEPAHTVALRVRDAAPNLAIGVCPVDQIDEHPDLVEAYLGFMAEADFVDPQVYPTEHDDRGWGYWAPRAAKGWTDVESKFRARLGRPAPVRRATIGCYRPPTRGGKPTPKREPPYDVVADVRAGRAAYPDGPLYTLEAAVSWGPGVLDYLRAEAAANAKDATTTGPQVVPGPNPAPLTTSMLDERDHPGDAPPSTERPR